MWRIEEAALAQKPLVGRTPWSAPDARVPLPPKHLTLKEVRRGRRGRRPRTRGSALLFSTRAAVTLAALLLMLATPAFPAPRGRIAEASCEWKCANPSRRPTRRRLATWRRWPADSPSSNGKAGAASVYSADANAAGGGPFLVVVEIQMGAGPARPICRAERRQNRHRRVRPKRASASG